MTKPIVIACATIALAGPWLAPVTAQGADFRRLSVAEYRDKMKGGWIGQIVGVAWGAPRVLRKNALAAVIARFARSRRSSVSPLESTAR